MRVMRIVNVIPELYTNEQAFDFEPSIAVNPANAAEMVITATGTPDGGVFYSSDGGENWSLIFGIPDGRTHDISACFAQNAYVGLLKPPPDGAPETEESKLHVLRVTDPLTGSASNLKTGHRVDQPWVEAITVIGGPDNGKDRLYVGYNDSHNEYQATVEVCLDARAAETVFLTPVRLDPRLTRRGDNYEVRPAAHRDGTVYVAYKHVHALNEDGVHADIVVTRDDNWGISRFTDLKDPDGLAGKIVEPRVFIRDPDDRHINSGTIGGVWVNNDLNIAVDPANSDVVYIVWCDSAEPNYYTLRVRMSLDRGVTWSCDLLTVDHSTLTCLAINMNGTVGLLYQRQVRKGTMTGVANPSVHLNDRTMETHFQTTKSSDGKLWDDTLLAVTPSSSDFTGDFGRLVAAGPDFYGVFPAVNTPDPGNFFPKGGGTFRYQRKTAGSVLLGNDGKTVIPPSVDPFFFKVQER
jgi:hypothetical protein